MIRLFLSLCSILPLKINHTFGALIGKLLYIFGSEAKKVSVKVPISKNPISDHAIVGAFWFQKGKYQNMKCVL